MNLTLLRTMVAVADHGSFSEAGIALNCVQSNITARIRRLERQFGQDLFERGRGGATLTAFGSTMYERAIALLAQFDAAERDLLDAACGTAPLRLGSMETAAAARLPELLKRLRAACPGSPISLRTGSTGTLLTLLWERKIDAAFVSGPIDLDRFKGITAFRERLVIVRPRTDAAMGTLFAFATGCSYRSTAETWLRETGRLDTEIVDMGSFDSILGCVEAEMGYAIAPERAVASRLTSSGLEAVPLPDRFAVSETVLAMRIDYRPVKAAVALQDLLRSEQDTGAPP